MKDSNLQDDAFINSLKQVSPQVPPEVKARLLYECGVAAAETKYSRQRRRYAQVGSLAVVLAAVAGGVVGNRITSQPQQPSIARQQEPSHTNQPSPSVHSPISQRNKSMMTAAMPMDKFLKLLVQKDAAVADKIEVAPLTLEQPFTTRSILDGLENL